VFINGADTKAAQMFTLAHELAHIWLGESALSDVSPLSQPSQQIELWCNRVAAEFLVPIRVFRPAISRAHPLDDVTGLARRFKVSTLVILRRIFDARRIDRETFQQAYQEEVARLRRISKGSGGNFYLTQASRVSRRFARAVVTATWEGRASFTESFRLLGCKKLATFREIGTSLGVHV
jgi:Zn-dependent peptidase ImmA (M78 family)